MTPLSAPLCSSAHVNTVTRAEAFATNPVKSATSVLPQLDVVSRERMTMRALSRSRIGTSPHVVSVCPGLQVVRADAGLTPTQVINFKTVRYWSNKPLVSYAVRQLRVIGMARKTAIAVLVGTLPQPAARSEIADNTSQETFLPWWIMPRVAAVVRTVPAQHSGRLKWFSAERTTGKHREYD